MKKLFLLLSLLIMTISVSAVPAKKGVWKTLTLTNGTEIRAQLVGDEYGHFWRTEDGNAYREVAGTDYFEQIDDQTAIAKAKTRRAKINAKRMQKRAFGHPTQILGQKKGIIILVNFKDTKFKTGNNNALYQKIANQENYTEGNFKGSMADYFKAQSRNLFELDFDVVGPYTLDYNVSHYGGNDSDGNDKHPAEMIIEAVKAAKDDVEDWGPYDWDGDLKVDQVYVVYAGKGEADGGAANTIWPHSWTLNEGVEYGDGTGPVSVGTDLVVDTYACGAELDGYSGTIAGIGTMCHEFSHCLGYPDFYDTDYSGGQGMCVWDLMDSGSYNGDSFQPAGYTSYERWFAGWVEPIVLEDEDVTVENMKSLQNDGECYIIYNKGNRNEDFLLETRQLEGWDASLPGAGLLILHADYDESIWENNAPNDQPSHQRMTWVPADKKYQYESSWGSKNYDVTGIENDPFPYKTTNAFNKDFSTTLAKLYNKNSNGTYYLDSSVENITQNSGKTISFKFVADMNNSGGGGDDPDPDPYVPPTIDGAIFYESFDDCNGKGGNDGMWNGQIAAGEFAPDNAGWIVCSDDKSDKAYGAYQCAKFGTTSVVGWATTPAFEIKPTATGTATVNLYFRAGAWNATKDGTVLNLSVDQGTIYPATVTLVKGEFLDYEATISATGNVKVTFAAETGRFFLDEVIVKEPEETTGIKDITNNLRANDNRIYTIDGRYAGNDFGLLRHGIYIVGGKKVVK